MASWVGLLKHGVGECVRVAQPLPPDWAQRVTAEIESPDIEDLLSAATKIERKLGAPKGGSFAAWLRQTVGGLRVRHREVPEALAALGLPLLTAPAGRAAPGRVRAGPQRLVQDPAPARAG